MLSLAYMNNEQETMQPTGHFTEVETPDKVKALEGYEAPHEGRDTVQHFKDSGVRVEGPFSLMPSQEKNAPPPTTPHQQPKPGPFFSVFGSDEGKLWYEELEEKRIILKEILHHGS